MADREPFDGDAHWIWCEGGATNPPTNSESPFRTCFFRKTFEAPAAASLTVNVSADTEYVLYCNGERVRHGPGKGDVSHQIYDEVTVDESLEHGENVLAALVVSYAPSWDGGPTSRMTAANGFVLDGVVYDNDRQVETVHTDDSWTAKFAEGYGHETRSGRDALAGVDERVDGRRIPTGWTTTGFDDGWETATTMAPAVRREDDDLWQQLPYRLVERPIPPLEERLERFDAAYQLVGTAEETVTTLRNGDGALTVPAGESVSFVLDAGEVTTGYPMVDVSGGHGSTVELTYGEALFVDGSKTPQHVPEKGDVQGHGDRYIAGGDAEHYEPVSWRAFRYVSVTIEAAAEPVTVTDLRYRFTGYPLQERATFDSSAGYDRLWDVAWRTVRRCSHETFEDCPYYEQLQYAGDTQPVMRFAGYVSGDWKLGRQAVHHFDWSRDETGLTKSRYPSRIPQKIPSWSLLWVRMVRDYWWFTGDERTVREVLDGVDATLNWFHRRENSDGLVTDLPHWKVVDWVPDWKPRGVPPGAIGGVSSVINLQYAAVLRDAAEIHDAVGDPETATVYEDRADRICEQINETCWDDDRGRYRDRPDGDEVSELGNAWAILSGAASGDRAKRAGKSLVEDDLAPAAWYGRYYVFRAASEAGVYDELAPDLLANYADRLEGTDLTTFPERYDDDSSYCHAWSSAPLYEFLGEILGVKPAAPGFEQVRIEPHLLDFDWSEGTVPVGAGDIQVAWERDDEFSIVVETPVGISGEIVLPDETAVSIPASEEIVTAELILE